MNVSLTPKLESFIRRKVQSGLYNNASEVVREGLRLLIERENTHHRRAPLPSRQEIRAALAELEPLLRKEGVSSLALFGSLNRGEARSDSDIDVLIDTLPGAGLSLVRLLSIKAMLEGRLGHPVDLVTLSGIDPALRESLCKEAERVF